jgi:hypothetical protein
MLKKLILTLILGMAISGPAAPILSNVFGIGSTHAYAADDDAQGDNNNQGEDGDVDGQ